jgi:hypothetical protein
MATVIDVCDRGKTTWSRVVETPDPRQDVPRAAAVKVAHSLLRPSSFVV